MNQNRKAIAAIVGSVAVIAAVIIIYMVFSEGKQSAAQNVQTAVVIQTIQSATVTQPVTSQPATVAQTAATQSAIAQTSANTQTQNAQTTAAQTTAKSIIAQETESTAEEAYLFQSINDLVTAKEVTNLRAEFFDDAEVVATLSNGTYLTRTGYNENGWSRLVYGSLVVYAKTSLLLKEGETVAAVESWLDEYNMTYQEVNEQVTAKEETNLRSVPSTADDKTIVTTIKHGEYVTRVGIGDKGWSKILYDGQTLYAVTNYLTK